MNLEQLINMFLLDNQIKGNSEKTQRLYEMVLRYFSEFVGNIDVNDITLDTIKDYQRYLLNRKTIPNSIYTINIEQKNLSRTTINTYMTHLRTFFVYLFENEYIDNNLFDKIKIVKRPKVLKEILTEEQIETVLMSFSNCNMQIRNQCIFLLMVDAGLRLNEIVNLEVDDILFNSNMIKINDAKGHKDRFVPISLSLKKSLYKYITMYRVPDNIDNKYLLLTKDNRPITELAVMSVIRRLKEKFKFKKFNPHMLRHTFATRYIINGGDMFSLQLILGHSDLSTCRKYVHLAKYYMSSDYSKISTVDRLVKVNSKIKI